MRAVSNHSADSGSIIKIPHFVCDERGRYRARAALTEAQIIKAAKVLLNRQISQGVALTSPNFTATWLQAHYRDLEHEVFVCLFLDNQHRIINAEQLFRGTIDSASVYPREVLKRALQLNAAALIFAHNHPSGILSPSNADKYITEKLVKALALVDIRVLDHFIVSKRGYFSFAEHGLL
ncbi:DNA repair protein RadC [Methylomonas paludis]|uniref:DNA repair protein RadC n=1 Tax=Methylomonas paludis TaxID=1173101 RepID=A0A975R8X0_9GAMM|nr:DNA repair protein RadC [Methylomonas paludis]QWF69663.1 DNA repair protein RadC [Methylomonas paludis]